MDLSNTQVEQDTTCPSSQPLLREAIHHDDNNNRIQDGGSASVEPAEPEMPVGELDEDDNHHRSEASLSRPLWWLCYLHGGVSQSLCTTPIMYLLNFHMALPLSMLPTFWAIEFMPFSFKPLYAHLASSHRMDQQLPILMIINAVVLLVMGFAPKDGTLLFLFLGFLLGLTLAWPELLLGLSLVQQATEARGTVHNGSDHQDDETAAYGEAASRMQAQAATARNLGSVTAFMITLTLLSKQNELDLTVCRGLLTLNSVVLVLCAVIASWNQVGKPRATTRDDLTSDRSARANGDESEEAQLYQRILDSSDTSGNVLNNEGQEATPCPTPWKNKESTLLVFLLQLSVIVLTLRQPMGLEFSSFLFGGDDPVAVFLGMLLVPLVVFVVALLCRYSSRRGRSYRVGIFFILRHLIPNSSFLVDSFRFSVFAKAPFLLQLLSLLDTSMLPLASWTFGRWFSSYSTGGKLIGLLALTTALAAITSLASLWFVHVSHTVESTTVQFGVAALTGALSTWFGEWSFLPELVLATVALKEGQAPSTTLVSSVEYQEIDDDDDTTVATSTMDETETHQDKGLQRQRIQYGTYVTCIDFGDQLGALLSGALISMMGITRENSWNHLDQYIGLCAMLMLTTSLFLLVLLR